MKISSVVLRVSMALLLLVSLTGCGEDDETDTTTTDTTTTDTTTTDTIVYSGLTTAAVIDSDNADDIAAGAIEGGQAVTVIDDTEISLGAVQIQGSGPVGYSRISAVSELLLSSVEQVDFSEQSNGVSVGTVTTVTNTVYGTCEVGGSAEITLTGDNETSVLTGTLTYYDYCVNDVKLSGTASLDASYNNETLDLSLDFSFDQLSADNGIDSITLDGDVAIDATLFQPVSTITANLMLKDNAAEKVYKLENYVMVVTNHVDYVGAVVSGKYYDPVYGYVDISTESTFYRMKTEKHAYEGAVIVTGHEGASGSNSKARITALDSTSYMIEADADGDGNYEWTSSSILWPTEQP